MGNTRPFVALTLASALVASVIVWWTQVPKEPAPAPKSTTTSNATPGPKALGGGESQDTQVTERPTIAPTSREQAAPTRQRNWATLTSNDDVPKVLVALAASSDLDAKAAIVQVAANCMSSASTLSEQQQISDIQSAVGSKAASRVIGEVRAARLAMRQACDLSTLNHVLTDTTIREAVEAAKASPARKLRFDQKLDSPVEYEQSAMLALSAPEKHPLAIDNWLDYGLKRALPNATELSDIESLYLRQTLYDRLVGVVPSESFRSISRCALQYSCRPELDLTLEQRSNIDRLASDIETLVRQQQWALLGIR